MKMRLVLVLVLFWEVCLSMTVHNANKSFKTDAAEGRSMLRPQFGRSKRSGKDTYVIDLYIVFDQAAKDFVSSMEQDVLRPEKVTLENFFNYYYKMLVMSINTFMKSLHDKGLKIHVRGMGKEVLKLASIQRLNHKRWESSERQTSCVDQTLSEFISALDSQERFKKYNHVMLVTGYILIDKTGNSVRGLSPSKSVCTANRYSAIQFDFNVDLTSSTAAQKIARSLGVDTYDGEGTASKCKESDGYVMAKNPVHHLKAGKRHWQFSSCSVKAIKTAFKLLDKKPSGNCLKKTYREENKPGLYLGKLISHAAQCKLLHGRSSEYLSKSAGRGKVPVDVYLKSCSEFQCVTSKNHVTTDVAYWGTPCDTKKWCINNKCVRSSG